MSESLPPPFTKDRLPALVRLGRALVPGKVLTLEEVSERTGLEPAAARGLLRELSKAGLVTTTVMNSGNCQGRKGGPQFFYGRPSSTDGVFEAAARAFETL